MHEVPVLWATASRRSEVAGRGCVRCPFRPTSRRWPGVCSSAFAVAQRHEIERQVSTRCSRSCPRLKNVPDLKTIVFQIGSSYRQRLEAVLADMGLVTVKPLEFGSLDAILSCVSAGIGVALLPKGVVAAAWQEGLIAVHELPPERALVDTLFVRRTDTYLSSAMSAFVDLAKSP